MATNELRPHGFARFIGAPFLVVWLCGWAVAEGFALWVLTAGAIALLTGTPPGPGRQVLELGPALTMGAFLVFWLTIWTIGGYAAIRELLRILWSRDVIDADPAGIRVRHQLGPFRWTVEIPRATLFRIYLVPRGKSLCADTGTGPLVLSSLGSPLERSQIAAALRTELGVPEEPSPDVASLPDGWQEILTPEGEQALVKDLSVRQKHVYVALGFTFASAVFALTFGALCRHDPKMIGLTVMACTATAGLAWGTAHLARSRVEWRIGNGSLMRRRRVGTRLRDLEDISRLRLTQTSDSDGDVWYKLEAVPVDAATPRRFGNSVIERVVSDPAIPRRLGAWLAERAKIPLEDAATPQALKLDLDVTLARLRERGAIGRTVAGWLEGLAAKQRDGS
jgi:hypothetical protein